MNDFDVMFYARFEEIHVLQHVTIVMCHKIGSELISVVKLLVYRVNSMIRVNHLLLPSQVSYLTISLSMDK